MSSPTKSESPAGRATARPAALSAAASMLNRVIWRWHFWAGLLVGPVLLIASTTGALYVFKEELEAVFYADILKATGDGSRVALADLVDAAQRSVDETWTPTGIGIDNAAGGIYSVAFTNEQHEYRPLYVDANRGTVLGEISEPNFFSVVLDIHRTLFAGTLGRVLVELTTCWTVLLTLTGLWLWWPKTWRRLGAALMPRFGGKRYVLFRDLHAIPGALGAPLAIIVAVTGLLYSVVWGTSFLAVGYQSGAFDIVANPPKSTVPADAARRKVTPDEALAIAVDRGAPTARITVEFPHGPDGAYAVQSGRAWGPSISFVAYIDQYSGEVLQYAELGQLPWMAQWTQWNYPLHVGSVMGVTTKLLWVVVCLILAAAPITGVCMWLYRRKAGTWGFPNRYEVKLPKWLVASIVALGTFMPLAGLSMIVVGFIEWVRARRHRSLRNDSDATPDENLEIEESPSLSMASI